MQESHEAKFKRFGREFLSFLLALITRASAFITGGLLAALVGIYFALGRTMPSWIVVALVTLAFTAAAFVAHRDQSRIIEAKDREIESIQKNHLAEIQLLKIQLKEFVDRKGTKNMLGTALNSIYNRLLQAKQISYVTFSDDLQEKEYNTTLVLLKSVESLLDMTLSAAEAAFFRGASPPPLAHMDDYEAFALNRRAWQRHVNLLQTKYDELKKIVERL